MSQWFRTIQIAIAVGLVSYLLWRVGLTALYTTIAEASAMPLALGAIAILLGFWLNGLAQGVVMRAPRRGSFNWHSYHTAFFHTTFVALWLPGRMGDVFLAYLMRNQVPAADTVAYVLIDKLVTLGVMLLAGIIGVAYFLGGSPEYWLSWGALCLLGGWLALLSHRSLLPWALERLPTRIRDKVEPMRETLDFVFSERKGALIVNFALTIVRLFVVGYGFAIMLEAFGETIVLMDATLAVACVQLLSLFPISIQGLGVTEAGYLLLLAGQGISEASILVSCFLGRVLSVLLVFLVHITFTALGYGEAKSNQP